MTYTPDMRSLSVALLTTLSLLRPDLARAGGDYAGPGTPGNAPDRVQRVQVKVAADFLGTTLELAIKGKDRTAVDARLETILETLRKRFEGQDGWEARELDRTFAAPVRKSGSKSSFISLSVEDEEPKADQPVVATARFSLRGPAENGLKTVEILRAKASDLVDPKNEDERSAAWARRATSVKNIADLARRPGVVLDERFELDMKEAAMIGTPEAWQLPKMPVVPASLHTSATRSSGKAGTVSGK